MTVLSLQRLSLWGLAVRPQRRAANIRRRDTARRERRTYPDSFFTDPTVMEDDSRRMSRRGAPGR